MPTYYVLCGDLTPNRATVTSVHSTVDDLRTALDAEHGEVLGLAIARDRAVEIGERIWIGSAAIATERVTP